MSDFPDFSSHGYEIIRELGHNRAGGRVTYLATHTSTQQSVVIKQFQFAQSGASWAEYDSYDREIQVLQQLNHSGIPRYLDCFQTPTGFCMVQEYKNAPSLATIARVFLPDEVKEIAEAVLEILVYLQQLVPAAIHRDIKPENILLDRNKKVYLVDFGFARIGGGDVAASSVVKGTLGFMPPEQLFNRQLTEASDLYGLGVTLVCLLTGTKSTEIGTLIDGAYRIHVKQILPQLNPQFASWLQKMAEPNVKDRYPHAAAALSALGPINASRNAKQRKIPVGIAIAFLTFLIGGLGLGSVIFSGAGSQPQRQKKSDYVAYSNVTLTTRLNDAYQPVNNVKEIYINKTKAIYFYASFLLDFKETSPDRHSAEEEFAGNCKIYNALGTIVYEGKSTLVAKGNKLQTWCVYKFDKKFDLPGVWKFEFYLDGKKVATENLTVALPGNRLLLDDLAPLELPKSLESLPSQLPSKY